MFLPRHGTRFLVRGVGAFSFLSSVRGGVTGSRDGRLRWPATRDLLALLLALLLLGVFGRASAALVDTMASSVFLGSGPSAAEVAISACCCVCCVKSTVLCLRVSVLDRALGCWLNVCSSALPPGFALGVLRSLSSSHAAPSPGGEPLSEECSLSDPSLSQWRGSACSSVAVC